MPNNFKITIQNIVITILALVVFATLNVHAGSTTFFELIQGDYENFHPYCDFIMFYWIFLISLCITVILSLFNRYDFSVISGAILAVSSLIILVGTENVVEFIYILYSVVSIIIFVVSLLAKKTCKKKNT